MPSPLSRFQAVEKKLAAQPWFKKEGWRSSVHGFPREAPEGITFHVFKKHWPNEGGRGIHIESYLAIDPAKAGKTYVTMHVFHRAVIPGTKLKRIALSKPFVDAIYGEVKTWEGYKFRAGKYGQQPFTKHLDGKSEHFERELEREVTRLCRTLGPVMDRVLRDVLGECPPPPTRREGK
jgi:hypothetical protein